MSCCGTGEQGGRVDVKEGVSQRALPYKYLFKYIIVGDTGLSFLFPRYSLTL